MNLETKVLVALLSLGAQLGVHSVAQAEPVQSCGFVSVSPAADPGARPEQGSMVPVSVASLVVAGRVLGEIVAYDNPATARPADGFELYDRAGELLVIAWFDRFGIRRMAVDRALVEGGDELQGVFVSLVEGDTI